jgi:hypothetical protein
MARTLLWTIYIADEVSFLLRQADVELPTMEWVMDIFWFVIIICLNVPREEEEDDEAYDESLDEFEFWPF